MAADDSTPPDDDQFLERLRGLAGRLDPEPDAVRAGALAAFSWRTIDADLAAISGDTDPTAEPQRPAPGDEAPEEGRIRRPGSPSGD